MMTEANGDPFESFKADDGLESYTDFKYRTKINFIE